MLAPGGHFWGSSGIERLEITWTVRIRGMVFRVKEETVLSSSVSHRSLSLPVPWLPSLPGGVESRGRAPIKQHGNKEEKRSGKGSQEFAVFFSPTEILLSEEKSWCQGQSSSFFYHTSHRAEGWREGGVGGHIAGPHLRSTAMQLWRGLGECWPPVLQLESSSASLSSFTFAYFQNFSMLI